MSQIKHVYPTAEMPHFGLSGSFCCGVQNFNSLSNLLGERTCEKTDCTRTHKCMFLSLWGE